MGLTHAQAQARRKGYGIGERLARDFGAYTQRSVRPMIAELQAAGVPTGPALKAIADCWRKAADELEAAAG